MNVEMPEPQTRRRVVRKRWLWWLVGLGLVVSLVLSLTPQGLGYGLKRALLDQGLERVKLENVDFNPFTGRLTVDGLEASAGGRVLFRVPKGFLDLGWLPLLRKRVYIEQVILEGAEVVVIEEADGSWRYGGMEPPWEEKVAPVEDAATLWEVGARELRLVNTGETVCSGQIERRGARSGGRSLAVRACSAPDGARHSLRPSTRTFEPADAACPDLIAGAVGIECGPGRPLHGAVWILLRPRGRGSADRSELRWQGPGRGR